jgi:hypothetical protein
MKHSNLQSLRSIFSLTNNSHPRKKWWQFLFIPVLGFFSLFWFLIRVIPKPSRATYPCMRVAAPLASSFILYLLGILGSFAAFKKAKELIQQTNYIKALLLITVSFILGGLSFLQYNTSSYADEKIVYEFNDPLGPNNPIGTAKGIFPGRVVWVYDPDATNENCQPDTWGDGYFLDKNCNQEVVDEMFSNGLKWLTGKETHAEAWDAIFRYYNQNHQKGDVGYSPDETIFIKTNAVHAWTTNADASIKNDNNYGNVDTSPQAILTMLRHLINEAGVPQENIYIGDPYTNIFKHIYDKLYAEFPNIHYLSQDNIAGRTLLVPSDTVGIFYSDKATVMDEITQDYFYKYDMNADYVINIPAFKGHRWGGVTFFAKNHFGSNTRNSAYRLHKGLHRTDYNQPLRTGYKKYRVFVDLMGNKHLGGKTLLFFMDGLWGTSEEHLPPTKFQTAPFNNDWSSSLFFSLDPVAISSVCLDILQKEFTVEDANANPPRYTFVQWDGVDDFLHQAASSEWWPDSIQYDPEDDGTQIGSLGVHEHWNNVNDMLYSRNLETGDGIELIRIFETSTVIGNMNHFNPQSFILYNNYPNPFNPLTTIKFYLDSAGPIRLEIYNIKGQIIDVLAKRDFTSGEHTITWKGSNQPSGTYFYKLSTDFFSESKKMILLK